jgi:hypothetical protein
MEKPISDEAREIIAQARRLEDEAIKLPIGAILKWCEKMEEADRLYQFAEWLK